MKNILFINKKYKYSFLSITRKYLDNTKHAGAELACGQLMGNY